MYTDVCISMCVSYDLVIVLSLPQGWNWLLPLVEVVSTRILDSNFLKRKIFVLP